MVCTAMCDNENENIRDKADDSVNEEQLETEQLICKDLSFDQDELGEDMSEQEICTANEINLPNDAQSSSTHFSAVHCSGAGNQILEPNQPAIQERSSTANVDCAVEYLQTTLAQSVSKILGLTSEVKTLDKARKLLHEKQNSSYHHGKYKDILALVQTQVTQALVQTQVLAAHAKKVTLVVLLDLSKA